MVCEGIIRAKSTVSFELLHGSFSLASSEHDNPAAQRSLRQSGFCVCYGVSGRVPDRDLIHALIDRAITLTPLATFGRKKTPQTSDDRRKE